MTGARVRALMCPPDFFTVRDVKNPFMAGSQPVDAALARRQWDGLRAAFEREGIATAEIPAAEDLEDMVFAANQVFVGRGAAHARFVVPSRMRYASREREVPHYVAWFSQHEFDVLDLGLTGDEYLEGHGDLIWQPGNAHVWAGFGFRSSRSGVQRFAAAMAREEIRVTPVELIDETFYHLDTCFAALNERAAIVYPAALSAASMQRLRDGWERLYEADRDDALAFACNGAVANGCFFASHASENVLAALRAESLRYVKVDVSEFEKAGGSVFCMKTFY